MVDSFTNFNESSKQELIKVMNIPFSVIIASFIIIFITTNMSEPNGLSALLGGYAGLLLGMVFVIILLATFTKTGYLSMFPIIMVIFISCILMFYLITYFERISNGEVPSYYSYLSYFSTIFLLLQITIIFNSIYKNIKSQNIQLFSDVTLAWLSLFGLFNGLFVITLGIVLHFYSTQG